MQTILSCIYYQSSSKRGLDAQLLFLDFPNLRQMQKHLQSTSTISFLLVQNLRYTISIAAEQIIAKIFVIHPYIKTYL